MFRFIEHQTGLGYSTVEKILASRGFNDVLSGNVEIANVIESAIEDSVEEYLREVWITIKKIVKTSAQVQATFVAHITQ